MTKVKSKRKARTCLQRHEWDVELAYGFWRENPDYFKKTRENENNEENDELFGGQSNGQECVQSSGMRSKVNY